ncbi:hypothetical protein KIN20_031681 [Parelaphostrongylus tenuis]|uniref:Uncharacterized protein n=1 Tax=Parelaphostrongylus tenuis TaxID=148309 RepID=A0AAD5R5H6_PARTN|nr:hypothetical protein KIN20_031681 [Parelaphostrongylus tenuis]
MTAADPIPRGDKLDRLARKWPCSRCGGLLGIIHLLLGVVLTLFDMLTFTMPNTSYAISAAILYTICAILCFIATRRVDRCTQMLLMVFATAALLISCTMFLDSGMILNDMCQPEHCDNQKHVVHSVLIFISLSEFVTCIITLFVCYRSLRGAEGVYKAQSPYSTLIIGDFPSLHRSEENLHH